MQNRLIMASKSIILARVCTFCLVTVALIKIAKVEGSENTSGGTSTEEKSGGIHKRSSDDCMLMPECDASRKYRTANGQCNNLNHPLWGSAMYCQKRLLPASYVGFSEYRKSVKGGPLPPPRILSLNLNFNRNRPSDIWTHLFTFFGQQIAHDITIVPISTEDGQEIQCCPPERATNQACKPILLPKDDPFYSQFNVTCLNFVRSMPCAACTTNSRQIPDAITSFIDASFVYGSSEEEMASLRANDGTGRLIVQKSDYGDLLPPSLNPESDSCSFPEKDEICFRAGDSRVNQHTTLTSLQTIFMRQHNSIVEGLNKINPQWEEDTLFQEARRIVGAQLQAIVFKEYLPIALGNTAMSMFDLGLSDERTTYDPTIDPTTLIEFSTAAYRFGHTLINSYVTEPLNVTQGFKRMRNLYFRPFGLDEGYIGPLMDSVSSNPSQQFDRHLVTDATNYLYRSPGQEIGLDLAAFDINRGRDHGLPPYVDMVRYCSNGDIEIKSFEDLVRYKLTESKNAEALQMNYKSVYDIDLWEGILMEIPKMSAAFGPTASCIITKQFYNLKFGDRYYFEHGNEVGSFTDGQLEELKKTQLSTIICANTNTDSLPRNPMLISSENNPIINCGEVTAIDLSPWNDVSTE